MISGVARNIQNDAAEGATVELCTAKDTAVLQTITAKASGKFSFSGIESGPYIIMISSVGNKKYISGPLVIDDLHQVIAMPAIILSPARQTQLKEVVVTSKKPLIEYDIDKTIVNVEAMIISGTGNALEVLEKTPGIVIDNDGTINLNGRAGVIVLIDGRQTYMSQQDLAAYLRSIPAGTLDKIELMTNPPAKYDAAGSAVINIRFKKNRVQGYTGSLSLSYTQGKRNRNYNSLNLNYLNKKVNLFGTISANKDRSFSEDRTERIYYNNNNEEISSANLKNYNSYKLHDFTGRVGMDLTLSSKTTFGFIGSVYNRINENKGTYINTTFIHGNSQPGSSGYGNSITNSTWKQQTFNINFQHKFNTSGRELSADINYINYNNGSGQLLGNVLIKGNGGIDSSFIFHYDLPSDIHVYNGRLDYSHPLKNKFSLSAGMKSNFVKNDRPSYYTDIINNASQPDLSKSNHFIYNENINGLYVNLRKDWKRIGGQLGLRVENTNTKGHQLGNAMVPSSTYTNHYTGLFPSLFINYKMDSVGKNTISIAFTRRINRPNYQQLNPFMVFIDQYSYSTGNPYLQPAYNYYIELNYRYKQFLSVGLQYDRVNNVFFNATQSINSKFISKPENASTRYLVALMTNLNFPVTKWWRLNMNIGAGRFRTMGSIYNQSLDKTQYAYRINALNQFNFPGGWSGEISGRYSSRIINLQRIDEARWQVNAGILKRIMKNKATIRLTADDIFWSMKIKDRTTGLNLTNAYHVNLQDSRRIGMAFNFNFGKETFTRKRRYNDNGADDVKDRVN